MKKITPVLAILLGFNCNASQKQSELYFQNYEDISGISEATISERYSLFTPISPEISTEEQQKNLDLIYHNENNCDMKQEQIKILEQVPPKKSLLERIANIFKTNEKSRLRRNYSRLNLFENFSTKDKTEYFKF